MPATPYLILFDTIGSSPEGIITSTQQARNLPFAVKRVFWTYGTAPGFIRGRHANKQTEEVIVAVTGQVKIVTRGCEPEQTFVLDNPSTGLYLPAMCWADLYFSEGAIALCLASTDYDPEDYIRDFEEFRKLI